MTENPKVPSYRKQLASNHNNQGLFLASQGKFPSAEEHYRKALDIQEKLVAEMPGNLPMRSIWGVGIPILEFAVYTGKKEEGITFFSKAIQTLTPVVTKVPSLITARNYLRTSHSNRARALSLLNRFGEAIPIGTKPFALVRAWKNGICVRVVPHRLPNPANRKRPLLRSPI